ncbi:MAG: hypothetical protein M0R05_04095 [Bacilli bacterium]|nr:hypothetical protein [Bacilli bacterium]MDD4076667.1 hypothetical protein [Bacilli bacterium]MDD4388283.1 hypothetical protein [Bacilli bacterium]
MNGQYSQEKSQNQNDILIEEAKMVEHSTKAGGMYTREMVKQGEKILEQSQEKPQVK